MKSWLHTLTERGEGGGREKGRGGGGREKGRGGGGREKGRDRERDIVY